MRLILCLAVACDAGRAPAPPPQPVRNTAPPPGDAAAALDDRGAVIMTALHRYELDATTLADAGLVHPNHIVVTEPGITLSAPWIGMTLDQATAAATTAHEQIGLIHVYRIAITGDHADLVIGGDIVLPSDDKGIKMCCCKSMDAYVRHGATWVFDSTSGTLCS
jgi:hypothetical protein